MTEEIIYTLRYINKYLMFQLQIYNFEKKS